MNVAKAKALYVQKGNDKGDFFVGDAGSELYMFKDDVQIMVDWENKRLTIIDEKEHEVLSNIHD